MPAKRSKTAGIATARREARTGETGRVRAVVGSTSVVVTITGGAQRPRGRATIRQSVVLADSRGVADAAATAAKLAGGGAVSLGMARVDVVVAGSTRIGSTIAAALASTGLEVASVRRGGRSRHEAQTLRKKGAARRRALQPYGSATPSKDVGPTVDGAAHLGRGSAGRGSSDWRRHVVAEAVHSASLEGQEPTPGLVAQAQAYVDGGITGDGLVEATRSRYGLT